MNYERLRESLKKHEGYENFPYVDTKGKITIGIGHNLTDNGLSDEVIQLIFAEDIDTALITCNSIFPEFRLLPENVQNVLAEMSFQLGYSKLSKFVNMIDAVNKQDFDRMKTEMKNSLWYRQVTKRAEELISQVR